MANECPLPNHCGHKTGKSWDTGAATHGGVQIQCCECGLLAEVPYTVEDRPVEGHGRYSATRTRVYDWSELPGWKPAFALGGLVT